MEDVKYTIDRQDEHSPWVVTFTCGSVSHPMPVTGSLAQVRHFAEFAMQGLNRAVTLAAQQGFESHLDRRFGDWIRAQFLRED
jgi:hypothetical protein